MFSAGWGLVEGNCRKMQGRGLAIAGVRGWVECRAGACGCGGMGWVGWRAGSANQARGGWGVRAGAKIAGVDWGGVWVGWSQLATTQSTEKQLNLELILFDERRFGTETKLQLLATFHSTEKTIKSAARFLFDDGGLEPKRSTDSLPLSRAPKNN